MRVVVAATAERDRRDIGDVIRQDNPVGTESFVDELLDRCARLAAMAKVFPLVPRCEHAGIRRRPLY